MDANSRKQVWADMAGYQAAIEYRVSAESEAMVTNRLQLLTEALNTSDFEECNAYQLAVQQDAQWVEREKIKFLRSEDFDPAATARRMLRHFALKQELFGSDKLGREIRISDLNKDDMESLRSGGLQFLPSKDHAGRGILFARRQNYVYKERVNMVGGMRCG